MNMRSVSFERQRDQQLKHERTHKRYVYDRQQKKNITWGELIITDAFKVTKKGLEEVLAHNTCHTADMTTINK